MWLHLRQTSNGGWDFGYTSCSYMHYEYIISSFCQYIFEGYRVKSFFYIIRTFCRNEPILFLSSFCQGKKHFENKLSGRYVKYWILISKMCVSFNGGNFFNIYQYHHGSKLEDVKSFRSNIEISDFFSPIGFDLP